MLVYLSENSSITSPPSCSPAAQAFAASVSVTPGAMALQRNVGTRQTDSNVLGHGVYTAFGVVVEGVDVVAAIEATPTNGETPIDRIEIITAEVVRR